MQDADSGGKGFINLEGAMKSRLLLVAILVLTSRGLRRRKREKASSYSAVVMDTSTT